MDGLIPSAKTALEIALLVLGAGVSWGVLRAELQSTKEYVRTIDQNGSAALTRIKDEQNDKLQQILRENIEIRSELKNLREVMELKLDYALGRKQ